MPLTFYSGNRGESDIIEDAGVDSGIILRRILGWIKIAPVVVQWRSSILGLD